MILSADLGGSATKLVLLTPDGTPHFPQRVPPERTGEAVLAQINAYLSSHGVASVSRLALTGVGSSFLPDTLGDFPTRKINEFSALTRGALTLSGVPEAVVVSMGTGTAFLHAKADGSYRHLGGSGIGGGTLLGLGKLLAGAQNIDELLALAANGSLAKIDWQMGDMALSSVSTLPPELTAANFGKLASDASLEDVAAGLINLVLQAAGSLALFAADGVGCPTILFAGALAELPQAAPEWRLFESVYSPSFASVPHAAFATAIGAGLCSFA